MESYREILPTCVKKSSGEYMRMRRANKQLLVCIIWNFTTNSRMSKEERAGEVKQLEWAPYSVEYGFYSPLMSGSIDGTDTRPHDRGVVRAMGVQCTYKFS